MRASPDVTPHSARQDGAEIPVRGMQRALVEAYGELGLYCDVFVQVMLHTFNHVRDHVDQMDCADETDGRRWKGVCGSGGGGGGWGCWVET